MIVAIVAFVVWAIMFDKKRSAQFDEKVENCYIERRNVSILLAFFLFSDIIRNVFE